jgi:hypothetical protein
VHFPVDTAAGHVLGTGLGQYFAALCAGPGEKKTFEARVFLGDKFSGDYDPGEFGEEVEEAMAGADGNGAGAARPAKGGKRVAKKEVRKGAKKEARKTAKKRGANGNGGGGDRERPPHLPGGPAEGQAGNSQILYWLWQTARNEWRQQGAADPVMPYAEGK